MSSRRRPRPARPDARNQFVAHTGRSLPASRAEPVGDLADRCFRLASIMAALDQGIAFVDPGGRILEVNDRYLGLIGRSRSEVLGQGLAELGLESEDYQPSVFLALFRRGVAHAPVSFNQRLAEHDVTVKLQPVREADLFLGLIVSLIDVTPLVEARLSVEREKGYLEQVITIAGAAICIVNRDDVVVTINDEFTAITGYGRDQALGRARLELLRERPPSPCPSLALAEDAARKRESLIVTRDGRHRTILKNMAPIRDESGEPTGGIESFVDITDLIRARLAAEEASRLKSVFLANMSHEIRTPLNAIMGLAQLLLRTTLAGEQRECLETIHAAGQDLLVVLNDVLDFSRIESGQLTIRPVPVDMVQLAEELRRTMFPAVRDKNLSLEIDRDPDLPRHLVCDPVRLKQILLNLLQNAVKFTDKGGVTLSLRCQRPTCKAQAPVSVRFLVQDTGCGIPQAMRERIFEPFVQAGDHVARHHGGTGLGLSIANRLVQLLGGTGLELATREGRGSVFSFSLRLNQPDLQTRVRSIVEPNDKKQGFSSLCVLVAEDNPFNRFLLQKILEKLGVPSPDLATDGQEAVDMILARQAVGQAYHVVFMDLRMPGLDGLEATRRIRAAGVETPIVALTAQAALDDAECCRQAGMTTYFPKPYRISDLEAVLTDVLPPESSGEPA
jgi:two-component system, sensor histidine kinase